MTNDTNNIFMERSIPTQGIFAADREVGIAHYGVNDAKNVTWTFGTFIDSVSEARKERIDDNQGQRFSGRLTWLPYYDEASNGRYLMHLGAGLLHTEDQDDTVRFRARPQIHEGPFLIDTGNVPASNDATRARRRPIPLRQTSNSLPCGGHSHAPGPQPDFTLGLNWYWSDRTRIMLDWIHPCDQRGNSVRSDPVGHHYHAVRFQFLERVVPGPPHRPRLVRQREK